MLISYEYIYRFYKWNNVNYFINDWRLNIPFYYSQVFKVARNGELKRYKPFKALHNRQLLWHGSRTTNFAGILSQGLRIAPPEAPVVSLEFYFAYEIVRVKNIKCIISKLNNKWYSLLDCLPMDYAIKYTWHISLF